MTTTKLYYLDKNGKIQELNITGQPNQKHERKYNLFEHIFGEFHGSIQYLKTPQIDETALQNRIKDKQFRESEETYKQYPADHIQNVRESNRQSWVDYANWIAGMDSENIFYLRIAQVLFAILVLSLITLFVFLGLVGAL